MKYGASRAHPPVGVIHFFKTSCLNKNTYTWHELQFYWVLIWLWQYLLQVFQNQKGFTQAKADSPMDEKRTCWLVLPAAAGVTWQTSGQVFKQQVCWGGASHVSPRTCYTICMWPDWMLVSAAGDEWGERGVRRRRWFGSLQSPPRTVLLGRGNCRKEAVL